MHSIHDIHCEFWGIAFIQVQQNKSRSVLSNGELMNAIATILSIPHMAYDMRVVYLI